MTVQDVLDNVDFNGFSSADESRLEQAIRTLYAGSATARETLDKVADFLIQDLDINFVPDAFRARYKPLEFEWDVEIDLNYIADLNYVNQNGTGDVFSLERGLIHEIIHAVDGLSDNFTPADYAGDTVNRTNQVMRELGQSSDRISYQGVAREGVVSDGVNYSQSETVDVALVGNGVIDTSGNGRITKDVMIGFTSSSNNFVSGAGRDFLWGNDANDRLEAGRGNDFISGGSGSDTAAYSGKCEDYTVSKLSGGQFQIVDTRSGSPDGTDVLEEVEYLEFSDGRALLDENGVACPGQNVVLAVDVSGSMSDDIAAVKSSATSIVEALFGTEQAPIASRFAIVTFNDTGAFRTELSFTDQDSIAERKAAALQAINDLRILGGGAEPLNAAVLSALQGGVGNWAPGATANRVIVFSDEPAADPGLRPQVIAAANSLGVSLNQPAPNAPANGPALFDIVDAPYNSQFGPGSAEIIPVLVGSDPSARSDFEELADATEGRLIEAADASEVVEAILEALSDPLNEIEGTDRNDLLNGTAEDDGISGLDGNDRMFGRGGDDELDGGAGRDTLFGQAGDDVLIGGEGNDVLIGGGGVDTAVFSGDFEDFRIRGSVVQDRNRDDGNEGRDVIRSVEFLEFDDGVFDVRAGVFEPFA